MNQRDLDAVVRRSDLTAKLNSCRSSSDDENRFSSCDLSLQSLENGVHFGDSLRIGRWSSGESVG